MVRFMEAIDRDRRVRVLVAHPSQQHSYQLASALKLNGELGLYATTVYDSPRSITRIVSQVLKGEMQRRAKGRRCENLEDSDVFQCCELLCLAKLFCMHVPFAKRFYLPIRYFTADRFAKKIAKLAIKEQFDAVITFDDTSPILFETLKKKAPGIVRILDMSAANPLFMRDIYDNDINMQPTFASKLKKERSVVWDPVLVDRTSRELEAAQYYLCASQFVVSSLEYSGIAPENCFICRYGVDTEQFSFSKRFVEEGRPVRFVYVGGTKEFKGISYLLDAFMEIDAKDATLTVVGENSLDTTLLQKYKGTIEFVGSIVHSDMPDELAKYDVMIFPSLGDGFGLAMTEGLASGLPVVGSKNSAAPDLIRDGEEGCIIPIQSKEAIVHAVTYFVNNKEVISTMSSKARKLAESMSWGGYYESVHRAIGKMLKGRE